MEIFEIILIGIALAMDAFAVSISKGLTLAKPKYSHYLKVGLWFGGFQALMPLIGYCLSLYLKSFIESFDHWVAFILLSLIGINIIRQSLSKKEDEECRNCSDFTIKTMFLLAVATSIDALAVGFSLSFFSLNIFVSILIIGVVTFIISAIGLKIGKIIGDRFKSIAEFMGGIILLAIGIKILIEHTYFH